MRTKIPDRDDVHFQRSEVARLTTALKDAEAEVARMTTLAESMRRQVEGRIAERDEAFAALSLPKPGIPQVSVLSRLLAAESWRLHTLAGGTTLSETEEAMAKVVAPFEQKVAALEAEATRLREELKLADQHSTRCHEDYKIQVNAICELQSRLASYEQRLAAAEKFKAWVHAFLDEKGVPADPDAEGNAAHGCRISGRMAWVFASLALAEQRQRELVAKWRAEAMKSSELITAGDRYTSNRCADDLEAALKAGACEMSEVKSTEAILQALLSAFKEADEDRLRETYKCREEAEKWKAEGDMYGWNFHQGVSAGTIWASIYFFRVQRRIENEIAALGITLKPDTSTTPTP